MTSDYSEWEEERIIFQKEATVAHHFEAAFSESKLESKNCLMDTCITFKQLLNIVPQHILKNVKIEFIFQIPGQNNFTATSML